MCPRSAMALFAIALGIGQAAIAQSELREAAELLAAVGGRRAGDTSLVREMAKNKPDVMIFYSGPTAQRAAEGLRDTISRHPDNRHKAGGVVAMPLAEAEERLAELEKRRNKSEATVLFVIARHEAPASLTPLVSAAIPFQPADVEPSVARLKVVKLQHAKSGLAFGGLLVAPDDNRLRDLCRRVEARTAQHYDGLPFEDAFATNRVAVFSTEATADAFRTWGSLKARSQKGPVPIAVETITWYPLTKRAELGAETLAEHTEAYFIDRSDVSATVPEPAAALLAGAKIEPTTVVVRKGASSDGRTIIVVSCPTATVLKARAARLANAEAVPDTPVTEQVQDLRGLTRSTLVVWGAGPSPEERDQIRAAVAADLRTRLGVAVEERGEILRLLEREIATQELLGATGTGGLLRQNRATRYIWVYRIAAYGGGTTYRTEERKLSDDGPPAYNVPRPVMLIESVGGGRADEIKRKQPGYDRDVRIWEANKARYEQEAARDFAVPWARQVLRTTAATVSGVLQLVDLGNGDMAGKVIWERQVVGGAAGAAEVFASDQITVRGVGVAPSSLQAPNREETCPQALLMEAAAKGAASALTMLAESAWLPDPSIGAVPAEPEPVPQPPTTPPADPPKPTAGPEAPALPGPKVALVRGNVLILKLDDIAPPRVGDTAVIGVRMERVPDPDDPTKTLRWDPVDRATAKVVAVAQGTADAVLLPVDAPKLPSIKAGMPVIKIVRPPAPAPKPAPAKKTRRRAR